MVEHKYGHAHNDNWSWSLSQLASRQIRAVTACLAYVSPLTVKYHTRADTGSRYYRRLAIYTGLYPPMLLKY